MASHDIMIRDENRDKNRRSTEKEDNEKLMHELRHVE